MSEIYRSKSSGFLNDSPLADLRVLVVDDATSHRKIFTRAMSSKSKHVVSQAENGIEAVYMVERARSDAMPFTLITMDFQMPIMDGPTATAKIREAGYKGLIIGVTGNGTAEDIAYFLSQGADKVLIKPVTITDIENLVGG